MPQSRYPKGYPRAISPGQHVSQHYADVKGGDSASAASDQAATHTNGAYVHALAAATSTTAITTGLTSPVVPRNVTVVVKAETGSAAVVFVAANVTVVGTDQFGNDISEDIAIQTGSVADTKFRWTVGTKVFATVTSIKLSAAQPSGSKFSVGLGTKLGLRYHLANRVSGDVLLVQKDAAKVTGTVDVDYHAVDLGADAVDDFEAVIDYLAA